MEVYIDGKKIECKNDIRVIVPVTPRDGITADLFDSDLEIILHNEGIGAELIEITERSAPSAEFTYSFWETFEEFIDEYMLKSK